MADPITPEPFPAVESTTTMPLPRSSCEAPSMLGGEVAKIQPGFSWVLAILLLIWTVYNLLRRHDAFTSRHWRLLCLGFLALNTSISGQLLRSLTFEPWLPLPPITCVFWLVSFLAIPLSLGLSFRSPRRTS